MNYIKLYNQLIENAQDKPYDGYIETHHIVPKCMGGADERTNLVKLSARQHFLAHWLLFKIHRSSKLANAWNGMRRIGKGQDERIVNSKNFKYAKEAKAEANTKFYSGENNGFFGKHHTEEFKQSMSDRFKGIDRRTPEGLTVWIEKVAKKPKSADHRKKIGRKGFVMLKNSITMESVRVLKQDVDQYDLKIWLNPSLLSTPSGSGSRWCNDGTNNVKLKAGSALPDGYSYGRIMKRKQNGNQVN